jgi:hypothetical protein
MVQRVERMAVAVSFLQVVIAGFLFMSLISKGLNLN